MPSRRRHEDAAFVGPRRSWRTASVDLAAGRGVITASAPADSASALLTRLGCAPPRHRPRGLATHLPPKRRIGAGGSAALARGLPLVRALFGARVLADTGHTGCEEHDS